MPKANFLCRFTGPVSGSTVSSNNAAGRGYLVEDSTLPVTQYKALMAEHGPDLAKLLAKCCALNPKERPSFNEVNHFWS